MEERVNCKLGDLFEFEYGKGLPKKQRNEAGNYPVYGSNGIVGFHDEYLIEGPAIIVGRKGAAGEVAFEKKNLWPIDTTYFIKVPSSLDFMFSFFLLKSLVLSQLDKSTAIPGLNRNDAYNLNISLPPLPEQRAIVSKIEQLFSELDNGISNLKLVQEQLKVYRQAVLKKAFEGNWEIVTIGDKFDFIGGGTPSKKEPKYWNGEIPWCSVKDIKGKYLHSTIDKITNEGLKNSASNLAKVDEVILVTRISPGKAIIAKTETAINQDLKIIKPKFKSIPLFVYYLFNSLENQYVKLSSGTTVLGINLTNLKSIPIPNIPFGQQQTIVHEIETRLSVCDKIEQDIAENLEKAEALRQSILKKAFEGKLLNEKELAEVRGAEDWEPAEVLLKRIKAEKAGKK